MSVVKINAIEVPEGSGPELEARFAARKHWWTAGRVQGFQRRPVAGENRYSAVTTWATQEDFQGWRDGQREGRRRVVRAAPQARGPTGASPALSPRSWT
ncbi:antibiotic biosynthesis monooxygenase [Kocuria rhizophila]|nr:antibiotic biosynthesis monooxygenase [Kocuria rhizophila]